MKFSIEAGKLKDLLEDLAAIAMSKHLSMPILSNIKIDVRDGRIIFFATNHEVTMTKELIVPTARPGMCTVPAKSLLDLLKAFNKEKKVTLSMVDDKRIRISQSRSRFNLSSADPHAYPEIDFPNVEYIPNNSESFVEGIDKVITSVAPDNEGRNFLQSMLFEPTDQEGMLRIIGTDGHKLTVCKIVGILPRPVLIPKMNIPQIKKVLSKTEEFGLFIEDDKQIVFKLEDGFLGVRLLVNKFPDYKKHLPRGSYMTLVIPREEMRDSIKRIRLFSDKNTETISLKAKDNTLTISSKNIEGDAEEVITIGEDSKIKGEVIINFNGKYLDQILAKYEKESVTLRVYSETSPVVFSDGSNVTSILMPVRR